MENEIYTEKRVNYDKLHSKLPIFRVKSVKIYTGQKKIYTGIPVAPVTNIRYESDIVLHREFGVKLGGKLDVKPHYVG